MRPMQIPETIPGLRWLTVLIGLFGIAWISLEGALWQVVALSVGLTLLGGLHLVRFWLGGRAVKPSQLLLVCAALGGIGGLACALLALALMAVKTGLHGHGPEFTPTQIDWVVSQMPLWGVSGTLAGLGLGLLTLAWQRHQDG
ncbi:MAG: hypothetical protein ACWGPS_11500 [Candidatus Promineifilaceae bacterium]